MFDLVCILLEHFAFGIEFFLFVVFVFHIAFFVRFVE